MYFPTDYLIYSSEIKAEADIGTFKVCRGPLAAGKKSDMAPLWVPHLLHSGHFFNSIRTFIITHYFHLGPSQLPKWNPGR